MALSIADIIYRTANILWGAGKGSNLNPAEGDMNLYKIAAAIVEIQENPTAPLQILDITVTGNQMTFTMSDGTTTFGPYTLPVAAFEWRDDWAPDTEYKFGDLFTAPLGMYLVLQPHTSDDTFNPAAGNMVGPYVQLIFPYPTQYDIGFFYPGIVGAGIEYLGVVASYMAVRQFTLTAPGFPLSIAKLGTAPADGNLVFNLAKSGVPFGTLTFATGATNGVFAGSAATITFLPGDVLQLVRTGAEDSEAKDMNVTIVGTKITQEESSESESE